MAAAEIPREWVRAVERDERAVETLTDRLAGLDAWVRATLTAAMPLVEARLREQTAGEIAEMADSSEILDSYDEGYIDGARHAARIARGNP
jgi:hypothetical protein